MIPVSRPSLLGNESHYVTQALEEGWVSSTGRFVDEFERSFSEWVGSRNAVSCSSGTTALHLAIAALGIGPGDEVIVPSVSFVATYNAVVYCGATPVFVDIDPATWGVSAETVAEAITSKTKLIIVVHLYGQPVHFTELAAVASAHGILIIEDSAEALGAKYRDRNCGTLGLLGTFSFYGNKVLTTGEGGMVVTDDDELARRLRLLRGQGQDPDRRYWHVVVGYNYRLTNLQCALGVAQLERLDTMLHARQVVYRNYEELIRVRGLPFVVQPQIRETVRAPWAFTGLVPVRTAAEKANLISKMQGLGVETRPTFAVGYRLPPFIDNPRIPSFHATAEDLDLRGLSLPTFPELTIDEQVRVVDALEESLTSLGGA